MSLPPHIKAGFPALREPEADKTSDETDRYNCIGWAAGDQRRWWEPAPPPNAYWPKGVTRRYTVDAYREAFESIGYKICADDSIETAKEKIALFMKPGQPYPSHAARQLPDGSWTSKLGPKEDIKHPLRQIEGATYGVVFIIMCRRRQGTSP